MAAKDTHPAVMADNAAPVRPGPGAASSLTRQPACQLPGYGPDSGHGRVQALLDLLAVAH